VTPLPPLNERFRFAEIDELVARKRTGAETMALDDRELDRHSELLDRLETKLQEAHDASQLPDEPTSAAALQDLVGRLRLEATRSVAG
jgi:hypothetical protein